MKAPALLIAALVLLNACSADGSALTEPAAADAPAEAAVRGLSPAVQRDLARARAATARFHRFAVADAADYDFLFLGICMENQPTGGMGYHYVNTGLLDSVVDVASPEALMYEPGPNGQLRLVGLEYVIPASDWTSAEKPMLFGREFALNDFDLWALHVWLWKHNPVDIFDDWNPTVSCRYAPVNAAAAQGAHH